jgi:phosphotransferase system enzyme I (PtsP)
VESRELQIVREIGEIISLTADYEEGMRLVAECVARNLAADACHILAYDDGSGELVMQGTYGLEPDAVHWVRVPVSQGIVGFCYRTQELVNVADMRHHPRYIPFQSTLAQEYRSLLAAPLISGGSTVGVIALSTREVGEFDPPMVAVVESIVSPLAMFVRNARLSEDLALQTSRPTLEIETDLCLRGHAVTDGIGLGRALFLTRPDSLDHDFPARTDNPGGELQLFRRALELARADTLMLQKEACSVVKEADAAIFFAQWLLLDDPEVLQRVENEIQRGHRLRFALRSVFAEFEQLFSRLSGEMVRDRLADLKDVILRIRHAADEIDGLANAAHPIRQPSEQSRPVVIAQELLPSQLIRLPLAHLVGIVCEREGAHTHAAILAKTQRIPMLTGVRDAVRLIHKGDHVAVDCAGGQCYVRPSRDLIKKLRPALSHHRRRDQAIDEEGRPAVTQDGVRIILQANVSLLNELPLVARSGAEGVGLYRTDFMFMIRNTYPSEEEQYRVFHQVVDACGDAGVTIRLLDAGGDKSLPYADDSLADDSCLGLRGLRFLLAHPQFLEPHVRAILRTTTHGPIRILLPMITDVEELLEIKSAIRRAEDHLTESGLYIRPYQVGMMLEVPSAFLGLHTLLPHVDFVSVGTNDLVQYTFAAGRGDSRLARWHRQTHPLLLQMLHQVGRQVAEHPPVWLSVCGEMAAHPLAAPFLVGCGIRHLCMSPWQINKVRAILPHLRVDACRALVEEAIRCATAGEVSERLNRFLEKEHIPPPFGKEAKRITPVSYSVVPTRPSGSLRADR